MPKSGIKPSKIRLFFGEYFKTIAEVEIFRFIKPFFMVQILKKLRLTEFWGLFN